MTAEQVLSSIDDTLAGYDGAVSSVGADMMRWSPERVICDGGKPLALERRVTARSERISVDMSAFAEAMRQISAAMERFAKGTDALALHRLAVAGDPSHWRARCRTCNPCGNPLPLAVDGRERNRRRKARQRRKAGR